MSCLWPKTRENPVPGALSGAKQSILLCILLLAFSCVSAWPYAIQPSRVDSNQISLSQSEQILLRAPAHIAELAPLSIVATFPKCENSQPPEALLTPDPLLPVRHDSLAVRVSFIIGSDGQVHSPFVLRSGGADEDAAVLRAVRGWRYRPALCNGVPTDSEARIRFSIHE